MVGLVWFESWMLNEIRPHRQSDLTEKVSLVHKFLFPLGYETANRWFISPAGTTAILLILSSPLLLFSWGLFFLLTQKPWAHFRVIRSAPRRKLAIFPKRKLKSQPPGLKIESLGNQRPKAHCCFSHLNKSSSYHAILQHVYTTDFSC